jgi:glycosyltransferase involved in cell wall biosynthesis
MKIKIIFDMRGLYISESIIVKKIKQNSLNHRIWIRLENILFENVDSIIILSEAFYEYLPKRFHNKTKLIYANVDTSRFVDNKINKNQRILNNLQNKTIFIYAGSLGHWHDIDTLMKIFSLSKKHVNNPFLIILSNIKKEEIKHTLSTYSIKEEDILITSCKPADVNDFLLTANFGIVPLSDKKLTSHENWVAKTMISSKAEEYMAAGLNLIFHNKIGGLNTIHQNSFTVGISYPFKEDYSLEHMVSKNVNNIIFANENFDININVKKYIKEYIDLRKEK